MLASLKGAAITATKKLLKEWHLIPVFIVIIIALRSVGFIGASISQGIVGGFIAGILQLLTLTVWYSTFSRAVVDAHHHSRFGIRLSDPKRTAQSFLQYFFHFDQQLFFTLLNAAFILFPAHLLISSFVSQNETVWLSYAAHALLFFLFNTVSEELLVHKVDGFQALTASFLFIKKYCFEWILIHLPFLLPFFLLDKGSLLSVLATLDPFMPGVLGVLAVDIFFSNVYLTLIFGGIVGVWLTIFRSEIYQKLR